MTRRLLPSAEWDRLEGTDLGEVRHLLDPTTAQVLVVEDAEKRIVGTWAFMPYWHVEGNWIAEEHRRSGVVARQLLSGIRELAAEAGAPAVMTASVDDTVSAYLERLGATPLPGRAFLWPMRPVTT